MSESNSSQSQSIEEEELRNLLKVQDNIDDVLHEVDEVVNATENNLFYVAAHQIHETYSKIFHEVTEEIKFTSSSSFDNNSPEKEHNEIEEYSLPLRDEQHLAGLAKDVLDETTVKGKNFSGDDDCKETNAQLCSKRYGKSTALVSFDKNMGFEPFGTIPSISEGTTEACVENPRYFSTTEEFPTGKNKPDGVGVKRPISSTSYEDHQDNNKSPGNSPRKLYKKRKIDFSNAMVNKINIQQKKPIIMDIKLARRNFRGPIGIPIDSIVVILDTRKAGTTYKYPIRKPEYRYSEEPKAQLKRAGRKICLTVHNAEEDRKMRAYPYVDDYIELNDTYLTQELNEEYIKIVHEGECNKIMDEVESNLFNSPNRTIKLVESSSGSSCEESCGAIFTNRSLDSAKFQEKAESKQEGNDFKHNIQTSSYEQTSSGKQQNFWDDCDYFPSTTTEPEAKNSEVFSDIVPLQTKIDVEMLHISKSASSEEEYLTLLSNTNNIRKNSKSLDQISDCESNDSLNFSSSRLSTSNDAFSNSDIEFKTNENMSLRSPSTLTPVTSSVSKVDASVTVLEAKLSDDALGKDDGDMPETLEAGDVKGENLATISSDKTLFNNETVNADALKKIDGDNDVEDLLMQRKSDDTFGIITDQINDREITVVNIDKNSKLCEGVIVDTANNNCKAVIEIDDSSSLDSDYLSSTGSSTPSIIDLDDFDSENGLSTPDSNKTVRLAVCDNFAFVSSELNTNLAMKTSKEREIKNFLKDQNSIFASTLNDSMTSFNFKNGSYDENIKHSMVATLQSFEDLAEPTIDQNDDLVNLTECKITNPTNVHFSSSSKVESFTANSPTNKNYEVENAKSPDNQNEDIVILSDSSTISLGNTREFKKENFTEFMNTEDGDSTIYSDNENVLCDTENFNKENVAKPVESQNNDIIELSDSDDNFSSQPTNNQDEDLINLSDDSTTYSNIEYFLVDNTIPHQIENDDVVNLSDTDDLFLNDKTVLYNTKDIKRENIVVVKVSQNQVADIVDLCESSLDSSIDSPTDKENNTAKFHSDDKDDIIICDADSSIDSPTDKENNTAKFHSNDKNDVIICDASSTSVSSNFVLPLVENTANFRNCKDQNDNQIIEHSDRCISRNNNNNNEFLSDENVSCKSFGTLENFKKIYSEKNVTEFSLEAQDFSEDTNFCYDGNMLYGRTTFETCFVNSPDDRNDESTPSAGTINSIGASSDNISENTALVENFKEQNVVTPLDIHDGSNVDISDTGVNFPIEENLTVPVATFENVFYQHQNAATTGDTVSASSCLNDQYGNTNVPYFVSNGLNISNNTIGFFDSTNISLGENTESFSAEITENCNRENIFIPHVDVQVENAMDISSNILKININDIITSTDFCTNENTPHTGNFKENCAQSSSEDHNKSTINAVSTTCVANDPFSSNHTDIASGQKIACREFATCENFVDYQDGSTDITSTTSVENILISSSNKNFSEENLAEVVVNFKEDDSRHTADHQNDGFEFNTTGGTLISSSNANIMEDSIVTHIVVPIISTEDANSSDKNDNIAEKLDIINGTDTTNTLTVPFSENTISNTIPTVENLEQNLKIGKLSLSLDNSPCNKENLLNIIPDGNVNYSSGISHFEIIQKSEKETQNNISKVDASSALNTDPKTLKATANIEMPPLTLDNTENTLTNTKNILELPHINSEIGVRPGLLNITSPNIPYLNLSNSPPAYVPTINIDFDFATTSQCDNRDLKVSKNSTITSSEYSNVDVSYNNSSECKKSEEFTKTSCDNFGQGLKTSPAIANSKVQTNSLPDVPKISPTFTTINSTPSTQNESKSNNADSTSKPPVLSSGQTTIITGVKRPPPSLSTDNELSKRYKSSTSDNFKHQSKPSDFQSDESRDSTELADNYDPKWQLYNFSEPQDFFQAVANQWCMEMPKPHNDLTSRFCDRQPIQTNYLIPGNKKDKIIECLSIYEERLREITVQTTKLKHALDLFGAFWEPRRINETINKIKDLDLIHDQLRDAWDDSYQFYTYFKDPKTGYNAWYISEYHKNEIRRELEMFHGYEKFYGCCD